MLTFQAWWLLSGKSIAYYFFAVVLLSTGVWWMATAQNISFFITGLTLGLFSLYFFRLGSNIAEPLPDQASSQNIKNLTNQFVNIGSGTYNESLNVQGDYVQGNKNVFNNFNFGQDLSSAISEIKQLLKQVENQTGSAENAQQKIINDLVAIVRHKPELRDKLYDWLESSGYTSVLDEIDIAEKVVEIAAGLRSKPYKQSASQLDELCRRLKYLLKTAQWREADEETVRVVKKIILGASSKHRCTDIDVTQISPRQLKTINRLWLEASGGRFGFSVQKQIWLKILHAYQHQHRFNLQRSEYDAFVEAVGWSNEQSRVYHVDFDYLITNPRGHLPAKILLWESYDSNSNYCFLSACLFDDFMSREYSNFSFLPAWLRRYLLLD